MEDPNLPPDTLQSSGTQRPRRLKKLPTLEGAGDAQAGVGEGGGAGGTTGDAEAGTSATRPRRKKKRPPPQQQQQQGETASPDHGTAPISAQRHLLPEGAPGQQGQPKPRRKKRRPQQPQQQAGGQGEEGDETADAAAAAAVRRSPEGQEATTAPQAPMTRYIDVEGMPLAKALETVREDVVTRGGGGGQVNFGADMPDGVEMKEADEQDGGDGVGVGGGGEGGGGRGESNMSDTIFWQTQDARTFRAEKLDKYQQRLEQERKEREQYLEGMEEEDTGNRTLKCAIGFTRVYNYLGTVLLGLMPGFALLHTGYVWSLSSNYMAFLYDYSELSSPMPILYYVTLTLMLLSVLDRYDTGKLERTACLECVSFGHAGMVILLYVPAYVISNAMYPTDRWIRRYSYNSTAYAGLSYGDGLVQSWRIMDTVRAACLALGWLVIAFNPQFNRLAKNLETELDDLIGEDHQQRMEMGGGGSNTKTIAATATVGGKAATMA